MQKIPTLFVRDLVNLRHVINEVHPDCEWVGVKEVQQVATAKWDGTCTRCDDDGVWWARREVKAGASWPDGFELADEDRLTHKVVGWVPIHQSSFVTVWADAIDASGRMSDDWEPGTYELCGPKINGNPHQLAGHELIVHGRDKLFDAPTDYEGLKRYLEYFAWEGIVWHAADGRRAKIKKRDFGYRWGK